MGQLLKLTMVKPGENAERSGLMSGDILLAYRGEKVTTSDELIAVIGRAAGASEVDVQVVRDGRTLVCMVEAGPLGVVVNPCDEVDIAAAEVQRKHAEAIRSVIVTTAPAVEGFRTGKTLDVVSAEYALGLNVFKDILTSLTDTFGGRSGTLQNAMRQAKTDALNDLRAAAHELGGNAVIATRIEYTEFSGKGQSMLLVAAYGTAVELMNESQGT